MPATKSNRLHVISTKTANHTTHSDKRPGQIPAPLQEKLYGEAESQRPTAAWVRETDVDV